MKKYKPRIIYGYGSGKLGKKITGLCSGVRISGIPA